MKRLLIAENSESLRAFLELQLCKEYEITTCDDGETALALIHSFRPHSLVLNLRLPKMDGISILRQAGDAVPQVILAISSFSSPYTEQCAKDLGVGFILSSPCRVDAVIAHLVQLERLSTLPMLPDAQAITAGHLQKLSFSSNQDGYHQLRVGIPLFAQDQTQRLGKELYLAIADLCGITDGTPKERSARIEHTIREAIKSARNTGDRAVWSTYFPGFTEPPCNKKFISRMAEYLYHP